MSLAFHKIISDWLLDGRLTSKINWVIRDDNQFNLCETDLRSVLPNNFRVHSLNSIENFLENVKIDNKYSPISLSGCHGIIRKVLLHIFKNFI